MIIAIFGLRQYQLAELASLGIQCGILACQAKLTLFFDFKDFIKLISRLVLIAIVIFLNDVYCNNLANAQMLFSVPKFVFSGSSIL